MKASTHAIRSYVWTRLGSCLRCMRISFFCAMASSFVLPRMAVVPLALCAIALTALWLAHISAFALKGLARRANASPSPDEPQKSTRRRFFADFTKLVAVVAVGSMVPRIAAACGSCTVGCMQFCGGANRCASGDGSRACQCQCN